MHLWHRLLRAFEPGWLIELARERLAQHHKTKQETHPQSEPAVRYRPQSELARLNLYLGELVEDQGLIDFNGRKMRMMKEVYDVFHPSHRSGRRSESDRWSGVLRFINQSNCGLYLDAKTSFPNDYHSISAILELFVEDLPDFIRQLHRMHQPNYDLLPRNSTPVRIINGHCDWHLSYGDHRFEPASNTIGWHDGREHSELPRIVREAMPEDSTFHLWIKSNGDEGFIYVTNLGRFPQEACAVAKVIPESIGNLISYQEELSILERIGGRNSAVGISERYRRNHESFLASSLTRGNRFRLLDHEASGQSKLRYLRPSLDSDYDHLKFMMTRDFLFGWYPQAGKFSCQRLLQGGPAIGYVPNYIYFHLHECSDPQFKEQIDCYVREGPSSVPIVMSGHLAQFINELAVHSGSQAF